MDRKWLVVLIGLVVVLGAGLVGVVVWLGPGRLLPAMGRATGDIASASNTDKPDPAGPAEQAEPVESGAPKSEYEPSSGYIEPGLDPDVTNFAMGAKPGTRPDKPRPEMLSAAAIQQVTNQHQHELVGCYADSLQEEPDLSGRVFFDFGVAPDGHVAMVKVTDSKLRSKATEDCFVKKARKWTFPATSRQVVTRFDTDFNFVTQ